MGTEMFSNLPEVTQPETAAGCTHGPWPQREAGWEEEEEEDAPRPPAGEPPGLRGAAHGPGPPPGPHS